jgi:hypothetical protein
VVYLTTLSAAQIIQRGMVEWLMYCKRNEGRGRGLI